MIRSIHLSCLLVILATSHLPAQTAPKVVTTAQVNGTWKSDANEFKIKAIGKQRLRVAFSGTYTYTTPDGLMQNVGETSGIARIQGDTAMFIPEDGGGDCQIKLHFTNGELVVTQEGVCPFGNNVSANGTYWRADKTKKVVQAKPASPKP